MNVNETKKVVLASIIALVVCLFSAITILIKVVERNNKNKIIRIEEDSNKELYIIGAELHIVSDNYVVGRKYYYEYYIGDSSGSDTAFIYVSKTSKNRVQEYSIGEKVNVVLNFSK